MKPTGTSLPDTEDFFEALQLIREGVPPGPCACINRIENWIRCSECPYLQQLWKQNPKTFLEQITRTSEE